MQRVYIGFVEFVNSNLGSAKRRQQDDLHGDIKSALKFRHWMAHGCYWNPKLGRLENILILDSKPVEKGDDAEKSEAPVITDFRRNGAVDQDGQRIDAIEDLSVDVVFAQKPWLALIDDYHGGMNK